MSEKMIDNEKLKMYKALAKMYKTGVESDIKQLTIAMNALNEMKESTYMSMDCTARIDMLLQELKKNTDEFIDTVVGLTIDFRDKAMRPHNDDSEEDEEFGIADEEDADAEEGDNFDDSDEYDKDEGSDMPNSASVNNWFDLWNNGEDIEDVKPDDTDDMCQFDEDDLGLDNEYDKDFKVDNIQTDDPECEKMSLDDILAESIPDFSDYPEEDEYYGDDEEDDLLDELDRLVDEHIQNEEESELNGLGLNDLYNGKDCAEEDPDDPRYVGPQTVTFIECTDVEPDPVIARESGCKIENRVDFKNPYEDPPELQGFVHHFDDPFLDGEEEYDPD